MYMLGGLGDTPTKMCPAPFCMFVFESLSLLKKGAGGGALIKSKTSIRHSSDSLLITKCMVMISKDGSTTIVNSMTPVAGIIMIGRELTSHTDEIQKV